MILLSTGSANYTLIIWKKYPSMNNFLKEISSEAKPWGRLNNAKYEGMKFHRSRIAFMNKFLAQQA
jgi:hypothetical protein